MTFYPLGDRALVRRAKEETATKSGILLPDIAQEKPQEGDVIAVGFGIEPDVMVGDRVLFGKWSGTAIKIDGEDLLILKESDILGVVREDA